MVITRARLTLEMSINPNQTNDVRQALNVLTAAGGQHYTGVMSDSLGVVEFAKLPTNNPELARIHRSLAEQIQVLQDQERRTLTKDINDSVREERELEQEGLEELAGIGKFMSDAEEELRADRAAHQTPPASVRMSNNGTSNRTPLTEDEIERTVANFNRMMVNLTSQEREQVLAGLNRKTEMPACASAS
jgi:hypothetical protein